MARGRFSKSNCLILGGGVSGLAAAQYLQSAGVGWRLLERCPTLGGLTRTVEVDRFCFDYTGHFLHLSRYATPSKIPFAQQNDQDWKVVKRRAFCWIDGHKIPAPIQYHIGRLPEPHRQRCVESLADRPDPASSRKDDFREFLNGCYGTYLAELFLIPQNEKTWGISTSDLSPNAAGRFFPAPDERRIRAGIDGEDLGGGYNAEFWYPVRGGISRLVNGLASGLTPERVEVNTGVAEVDLAKRTLKTSDGSSFSWERLLTSIPLRDFCLMTGDDQLSTWAQDLSASSTITYNLGIEGPVAPTLRDVHWMYVPDSGLPFYRVGVYSNVSEGTSSPGTHALYIECAVDSDAVVGADLSGQLLKRVLDSLQRLGWLDLQSICCTVAHLIHCAYVHLTPAREVVLPKIMGRLESFGVYPIGRYGVWDYMAIEDSIHSAISSAETALHAD